MNLDIELPSILKLERRLAEISESKEVSWDGDNTGAELYDFGLKNTFNKNYWICSSNQKNICSMIFFSEVPDYLQIFIKLRVQD